MTDKSMGDVLNDIVIIWDTREQKNQHILDYFEEKGIKNVREKLDTADYSFYLPHYPHLGLDKTVLVEKKNSLNEIVGNFTKDRARFTAEFERVDQEKEKIHLLIENATWKKIYNGSYRSECSPQSVAASILTWNVRYNCPIWFCTPAETGALIYQIIKYEIMEKLKNMP